jgi:hypothetical protein
MLQRSQVDAAQDNRDFFLAVVAGLAATDGEAVKASLVGGIGTGVSPFAVQGQIQPLDVAVVLGPIGRVRLWDHPGPSQHWRKAPER